MKVMYGSQWFSITDKCAKYILSNASRIKEMFHHGSCVDEHFLQTFIYNSDLNNYVAKEGNMRYILWEKKANSPHVFTIDDYSDIMNSNKLFVRKFQENIDMEIVKKIYTVVKKEEK